MDAAEKLLKKINHFFVLIGGVFLMAMILLTCANISFRIIAMPVRGAFELMGYFGAVVTAFSLAYTENFKGHIAVDILVNTFSSKTRIFLTTVNNFVLVVFFLFAAVKVFEKAHTLYLTGEVTETLRIIYYPFTFMTALGLTTLTLTFALNFCKSITSLFRSPS